MPGGPSTTRSAASATCGVSALSLATAQPGMPSARSWRIAAKAVRSPRSSPQNTAERAPRSAARPRRAVPLSVPGGRSSSTSLPGSSVSAALSASLPSGSRSSASAAAGSAVRLVCTASAVPLSSTAVPAGAATLGEQPGQRLARGLDARRHGRRAEHARLPALRAVVPENDEAGHVGEAAERDRVRGGPAGDDRHGADRPASLVSAATAPGAGTAAAGSSTIGARVPS